MITKLEKQERFVMGKWMLVFIFMLSSIKVFSQSLEIFNLPDETPLIPYCKGQISLGNTVVIGARDLDQPTDGIKVSVSNYVKGEDTLVFKGTKTLNARWDNNKGEIVFTGKGTSLEYQNAVHQVYYENLAPVPTLGTRNIVVTLSDADYLPFTQHFYRYIPSPGIYWTAARDAAQLLTYNGLQGYLATITSKEENDFIWSKINGVGWIGASDAAQEGEWKWVTGPEAGQQFWKGSGSGSPVNGMYNFWNTGEPNNSPKSSGEDEDYAHINMNPSSISKSWNDLSNRSDGPSSQYYYSQGYIVEFGGLESKLPRLSANIDVVISKIAFSDNRTPEICAGEKIKLNVAASSQYTYTWTPNQHISSTSVSNPEVNPNQTTTWHVVGNLGQCSNQADFTVTVHPLPISKLAADYPLCEGGTVLLDPGAGHTSYLWSNNNSTQQTQTVNKPGEYSVTIRNDYCSFQAKTKVATSLRPVLTFNPLDTLVCGKTTSKLPFTLSAGTSVFTSVSAAATITNGTSTSPNITVPAFGKYNFKLQMTKPDGCQFDSLMKIAYRHQPTADFNIDENKCYGYNLQVIYTGIKINNAVITWYSNDTIFSSGVNLVADTIPLGMGDNIQRSVYLKINEQGCIATSQPVAIKVKPDLSFSLTNGTGCSPLSVNFNAVTKPSIKQWQWQFGDGTSSVLQNSVHTFRNQSDAEIFYPVQLRVTDDKGCDNTDRILNAVKVFPEPVAKFTATPGVVLISNPQVLFVNESKYASAYEWDFKDGSAVSTDQSPVHVFRDMGFFDVDLRSINAWNCADTASQRVVVAFDKLFPPNAFSPNSAEAANREFRIYSEGVNPEGYQLTIFDRWGQVLFTSVSPETGWDGTMRNGSNAPQGVYVWTLQFLDFRNEKHSQKGTVALIY